MSVVEPALIRRVRMCCHRDSCLGRSSPELS